MKNGVPFDVAFSISDVDRTAWAIVFMEYEGVKFDMNTMKPKKEPGKA